LSTTLGLLKALLPNDWNVDTVDESFSDINFNKKYRLVIFTSLTCQSTRVYELSSYFKEKGATVIYGGPHASMFSDEASKFVDSVACGEAEILLPRIINDFSSFNLNQKYRHSRFCDLSITPPSDFSSFDNRVQRLLKICYPIETARGCPFNCDFCAVTKFFGCTRRVRPVRNVIEEISRNPAKFYAFVDDNIFGTPDYARELFTEVKKLGIKWFSQAATHILDYPDLVRLAGESGCVNLLIGFETLSEAALADSGKRQNTPSKYADLITLMKRNRVEPALSLIFGFDQDTPVTFKDTIKFLADNEVYNVYCWILTPIPGSALFNRLKTQGRLLDVDWDRFNGMCQTFRFHNLMPLQLIRGIRSVYEFVLSQPHKQTRIARNSAIFTYAKYFFELGEYGCCNR